jgi:hypothetical protein
MISTNRWNKQHHSMPLGNMNYFYKGISEYFISELLRYDSAIVQPIIRHRNHMIDIIKKLNEYFVGKV